MCRHSWLHFALTRIHFDGPDSNLREFSSLNGLHACLRLAKTIFAIFAIILPGDPLAVVKRVYQQLDITLSEQAAQRMRQLIAQRSRYRKHNPTLTEFGVDVLREARRFSRYCFRFGVPCQ